MSTLTGEDQTELAQIDAGVIIGYPVSRGGGTAARPLILGTRARLRSGTTLYDGSVIGSGLQTGHGVVLREDCVIGDDVSLWSNTVVDYGCRIGNRVKIHCNCYVAQFTEIGDDAFLAPGVTTANDLYPGDLRSAAMMGGPKIGSGAQIGVNVTILPHVRIGAGTIVGAGSVVTRDLPPAVVAFGNPATVHRPVADLPEIDERLAPEDSISGFRLLP
jgi:acetyltransferase-like isoleucine patch superfamily enzyme